MSAPLFPAGDDLDSVLLGPGSVVWEFASDARLLPGSAYALLLQVAHPTVGAGVRDFSDYAQRPYKRLFRTVDWLTVMVYGGAEAAAAGQRLRDLHKSFRGTREDGKQYYGVEREAYAWVHATLIDSIIRSHRQWARPMTPLQTEQFYSEYRGLGRLVGVREADLPETWSEFQRYFDEMVSDVLVHTSSVDGVLKVTAAGAVPPIPGVPRSLIKAANIPPARLLSNASTGLLPPVLRERFGLSWTARDRRQFERFGALSRSLTPLMPRRALCMGPAIYKMRRRAIARGPLGPGYDPERWRTGIERRLAA